MRYWAYLLAKIVAASALLWVVGQAILWFFPHNRNAFARDLSYTTAMMVYFLIAVGTFYLVVWDQRYRCRTCLRKLRMPITAGSWPNMFLKGQPRMEYICIYGHGTLKVPEVELTGPKTPDWQPHEDMWRELEAHGDKH